MLAAGYQLNQPFDGRVAAVGGGILRTSRAIMWRAERDAGSQARSASLRQNGIIYITSAIAAPTAPAT